MRSHQSVAEVVRISGVVMLFCLGFDGIEWVGILVCCVVCVLFGLLSWWSLLTSVFTMAVREATWTLNSFVVDSCLHVRAM